MVQMPEYIFRIRHHDRGLDHDTKIDLPDLKAAWHEATVTAGQLLKDLDGSLSAKTEWTVQILDDKSKPIRTIRILTEAHGE